MPIPRGLIRKITANDDTYSKALSLFYQGAVGEVRLKDTDFQDEYKILSTVCDNGREYEVIIEIDNYNEQINGYSCTCPLCLDYDGACRHIAATLISQENNFFNKDPRNRGERKNREKTDDDALKMILSYSQKTANRTIAANSVNTACLIPILKIDGNCLKLGLKIDVGRVYVIKDIGAFYENMKSGNVDKYGSGFMFLHDVNNFNEDSKPLLNFVMTYYSAHLKGAYEDKKHMLITGHLTDKLLRMLCGKNVDAVSNSEQFKIKITEKIPDFNISIKKIGKSCFGISLDNVDFDIIKGRSRIYIKTDKVIYCTSEEYTQKCGEILSILCARNTPLCVHADDMASLYSSVFKTISDFIPIKSREDLSQFRPLPLKTKIYLDFEEENLIAKVMFHYGGEVFDAADNNREPKSVGDLEGELCVKTVLMKYMPSFSEELGAYHTFEEGQIYEFLTSGIAELSAYGEIYASDSIKKMKIKRPQSISVGAKLDSGLLNIDFSSDDFPPDELSEILESYKQTKKYHRLKDGSFLSLESDVFVDILNITEGLSVSGDALAGGEVTVPGYRALYIDEILKNSSISSVERNSELKKLVRDMKYVADSDFVPPQSLKGVLRNYQKTGFRWLKTLEMCGFSGVLADDMGLGKTLQIISLIKDKKDEKGKVAALVVCPASLVLNWESEIEKFSPDIKAICVIGNNTERIEIIKKAEDYDVCITSYELLKRDISEYERFTFDYQVVDEAQYIKNYTTQNAKAVKSIKSKTKFALTGTPIENNLSELWSIFDFLMPGYLYSHSYFKNHFEVPVVRDKDSSAIKRLKAIVSPFILRRLKSDVLKELPQMHETVIYAKMEDEQKKIYAANAMQIKEEFALKSQDEKANRFMVLSMLMRLRQLCCHPGLVYDNYSEGSAKLELCLSLLESLNESGHKVLLFSQFTSMLDVISQKLDEMKIPYYEIRGSTKKEERKELVDRFNEDNTPVFLISLKAGGTGLNLTGADMVIHYDPWWNKSVQNQATDRAYRMGQKKSVQVYKLIVKDSIEEKILKLQEKKSNLADSIISGGELDILSLSKDEILKLFEI
ncbi:MAG: calcium-binding protein [Ruminococcaceae bacterium]|nr:calcium-binding protein [Oscillospiraceae bacterium]